MARNKPEGSTGVGSKRVKTLFKRWSSFYDHPVPQLLFYGRVHQKLLAALFNLEPESILDAGCGTGELFQKIGNQWPNAKLTGLDLSPEMLDVAREKAYPNAEVEFIEASVYSIPLPAGQFDLITNTISSHFYVDFERALRELGRVLKPGGYLAMASLTNGVAGRIPGPWKDEVKIPEARYRSSAFQKRELERLGFQVRHVYDLPASAKLFICQKV